LTQLFGNIWQFTAGEDTFTEDEFKRLTANAKEVPDVFSLDKDDDPQPLIKLFEKKLTAKLQREVVDKVKKIIGIVVAGGTPSSGDWDILPKQDPVPEDNGDDVADAILDALQQAKQLKGFKALISQQKISDDVIIQTVKSLLADKKLKSSASTLGGILNFIWKNREKYGVKVNQPIIDDLFANLKIDSEIEDNVLVPLFDYVKLHPESHVLQFVSEKLKLENPEFEFMSNEERHQYLLGINHMLTMIKTLDSTGEISKEQLIQFNQHMNFNTQKI